MSIVVTQDHWELTPRYSFEEGDLLVARTLSYETEMLLKERIYELQNSILTTAIVGTAEEKEVLITHQAFQKGVLSAFMELLENSKEAKILAQGSK